MAGQIIKIIDLIVSKRSNGNKVVADLTIAKLCMKGINPENYNNASPDDPAIIQKLENIARDLNIII